MPFKSEPQVWSEYLWTHILSYIFVCFCVINGIIYKLGSAYLCLWWKVQSVFKKGAGAHLISLISWCVVWLFSPFFFASKHMLCGNSLAVQWLGLHTFTIEGVGSISGWGTKVPQSAWHGQIKKSRSVMSDFLWPHGLYTVHGIL